jgi:transposase-like protein
VFKGRHFDRSVILLCVRWYLACNLSLRNLKEMMAERGIGRECHEFINLLVSSISTNSQNSLWSPSEQMWAAYWRSASQLRSKGSDLPEPI